MRSHGRIKCLLLLDEMTILKFIVLLPNIQESNAKSKEVKQEF